MAETSKKSTFFMPFGKKDDFIPYRAVRISFFLYYFFTTMLGRDGRKTGCYFFFFFFFFSSIIIPSCEYYMVRVFSGLGGPCITFTGRSTKTSGFRPGAREKKTKKKWIMTGKCCIWFVLETNVRAMHVVKYEKRLSNE